MSEIQGLKYTFSCGYYVC